LCRTGLELPAKFEFFVLGLLNSKLVSRLYLDQVTQATKDDFPQVTVKDILELPVPLPGAARHAEIVARWK